MNKIVLFSILAVILIGGYFLFFYEKCSEEQIFNPYKEECVGKKVLCNLNSDCSILEGQTAFFTEESLNIALLSADERSTRVSINGQGETKMIVQDDFSFGEYIIILESTDGDVDKIMGADFEVTKHE